MASILITAFQTLVLGLRRVTARHTKQPDVEIGQTGSEGVGAEPWRYIGYPGFVSFMASDPELLVVRRFDELHTRALLFKQDQVSELEERLKELDEKYIKQGDIDNGTFRGDMDKRWRLHEELIQKLLVFDKLFIRYRALCALQKPPKRIPETLQNWLKNNGCWHEDPDVSEGTGVYESGNHGVNEDEDLNANAGGDYSYPSVNNRCNSSVDNGQSSEINQSGDYTDNGDSKSNEIPGGAIVDKEALFVTHVEDLVAVRQSPKAAIREFFAHLVVRHCDRWFRFFRKAPPGQTDHWQGGKILVSNEELVNRFSVLFEFLVALVLFIIPLWILQATNSANEKLAVITIFVLACLAIMSFAVSGSPFQVLAATAGYTAVLVVFVQPVYYPVVTG